MSALPPKADIRAVVPLASFGGQNSISPVVIDGLHLILGLRHGRGALIASPAAHLRNRRL
jgi:hypothetical protein